MKWAVAKFEGQDAEPQWTPLGEFPGSNPTSALNEWLSGQDSAEQGVYGARAPGEDRWYPHRLDSSGFSPIDAI